MATTMPPLDSEQAQPGLRLPPPRSSLLGHWVGWRLRGLVALTLAACLAIFGWMRWLADSPHLPLQLERDAAGQLILTASTLPALAAHIGQPLQAMVDARGQPLVPVHNTPAASPRWTRDDPERMSLVQAHHRLQEAAAVGPVTLQWGDAGRSRTQLALLPRGLEGLGWWPWPLAALALLVVMIGAVVALSRPHISNLLYLLCCVCQGGGVLFLAAGMATGQGLPARLVALDMPLRAAFDIISACAALHAVLLYPQRLRHARWAALALWGLGAAVLVAVASGQMSYGWWWLQALMLACAVAGVVLTTFVRRSSPNPVANLAAWLAIAALVIISVVTCWAALLGDITPLFDAVVVGASLGLAGLLLAPFLLRSREAMREFVLLAGISTVAASLDVLFITVFSLGPFTSLTLVVFVALGLYAAARQWLFDKLLASQALTTERIFEQLYRAAREVQAHPERHAQQLAALLRDLFEPLEVQRWLQPVSRARVAAGGALLLVPVLGPDSAQGPQDRKALMLRYARRGQRIFTREDARLADRVVEQLRRAVAYDLAVERGRSEERQRIAQDLHDDIGARLLTLMYQAPNPEVEDYVRQTLKDLKTLTRGLAAGEHLLSHALAEWKADLAQRLAAARVELDWSARFDDDLRLNMVQWSAITRVLRELVSNTLHHSRATQVSVRLSLTAQSLHLVVADDGMGGDPQAWSQGLGLGGVRKRVKLLGGQVQWRQGEPRGIVCEVHVAAFIAKPSSASTPGPTS